jgi:hypothetical protein
MALTAEFEVASIVQQQQGGGQVNVIINVAMGELRTLCPFFCVFVMKRMFLCAIHFNCKTNFVFCSFFRYSSCCLLDSAQGVRALRPKRVNNYETKQQTCRVSHVKRGGDNDHGLTLDELQPSETDENDNDCGL